MHCIVTDAVRGTCWFNAINIVGSILLEVLYYLLRVHCIKYWSTGAMSVKLWMKVILFCIEYGVFIRLKPSTLFKITGYCRFHAFYIQVINIMFWIQLVTNRNGNYNIPKNIRWENIIQKSPLAQNTYSRLLGMPFRCMYSKHTFVCTPINELNKLSVWIC